MAIPLGRSSRSASRDRPGRRYENVSNAVPIWSRSRWGLPCRFRCRTRGALLPHHFTLTWPRRPLAVCFLWRYPWGRPRRALPGTVFPWSPDFPPRLRPTGSDAAGLKARREEAHSAKAEQPSGHLTQGSMSGPQASASSWARRFARIISHSSSAVPSMRAGRKWR